MNNEKNIEYTLEIAQKLLEEAKEIELEAEEKFKEILAVVNKIINFLEAQEAKKQQ